MPTITRKIELSLCTDGLTDEQRKAQWQLLYHINDNLYKAANNEGISNWQVAVLDARPTVRHAKNEGISNVFPVRARAI